MQPSYDLVLKGGRVIDPAQGLDGKYDVAVKDGRIAAVQADIPRASAAKIADVRDRLVLPGMIDTHAHVFHHVSGRFGLEPDLAGVHSGVTTLVDQGGASLMTFPAFRHFISERSDSRVLAFISAYVVGGLEGHYYPQLYGPSGVDVKGTIKAALANRDLVKGIKAHAEIGGMSRWGLEVIKLAKQISRETKLPLYIHFGQLWALPADGGAKVDPDSILPQVTALLDPGDILAHPFTRHPGGFVDKTGRMHPIVAEALKKDIKTDVGHGSHFSFAMCKKVLETGFVPDTLGADMHGYNTPVPPPPGTPDTHPDEEMHPFAGHTRFSLASAMTGLMACGLRLEQIVPMVTSNPAKMLKMEGEIGTLKPGTVADVSVLADERGRWKLGDNEGNEAVAERMVRPIFCLRAGKRFDADAAILPQAEAA
ncbi:MAG: amidohydrolase/deacetylase family metallohydrolase [Alphaproteobacteria bacterium]|nr:amidohydrolase/deacetylase family metallohydrolase [Alphaproteobacteria bacterium]